MRTFIHIITTTSLLFFLSAAYAQTVTIKDNGNIGAGIITDPMFPIHIEEDQANFSNALIYSKVLGTQARNDIGIWSICKPSDNFGTGGFFQGGNKGVVADVEAQFSGSYFGIETRVNGGNGTNYGIHSRANGSGINYAVYGEALNGGLNYGGYFDGKGYFSKDLILGDIPGTTFPLTIRRDQSDFLGTLVLAEVLGSEPTQDVAITGISKPLPGFGTGGIFEGGSRGLVGSVSSIGNGTYEGVVSTATGGTGSNYGLRASAIGSGTNYAVYGQSSGSGENWAGYFLGKGYFSENLGVGTSNPTIKLTVDGGTDASPSGGGYIMTNSLDGTNVVIDNNEIMARDNGSTAPLWINNEGGNVGINLKSSSPAKTSLHVKHGYESFTSGSFGFRLQNEADNSYFNQVVSDTVLLFHNTKWPGLIAAASIGPNGEYGNISDRRYKTNIKPAGSMLAKIKMLQLHKYNYIGENNKQPQHLGFMAQEVRPIFPNLVRYFSSQDVYHVNYSGFGLIAIKGIQELDAENHQLKEEINHLRQENLLLKSQQNTIEARVSALENKLDP